MSSRPEHPTHTTGAHRSRAAAPRRHRPQTDGRPGRPEHQDRHERQGRPEHQGRSEQQDRYEPHLDGLFTYCLSVLCEHDTAAAVLGEALALAERQHGRRPADPVLFRPWLYALARWACLRRLAEQAAAPDAVGNDPVGPDAVGNDPAARDAAASDAVGPDAVGPDAVSPDAVSPDGVGSDAVDPPGSGRVPARQRELAALAWPEAAGTTPEQREVLELSVRHRLAPDEIAAATGADPAATRTLLAAASCEVERTRAALAVVEFGRCPDVGRLAGDSQMLLGAALRRELVRHVDDCAECRRTAERATAAGPWPGSTALAEQGALPLVPADRAAVCAALATARASRSGRAEGVPGAGPVRGGRSAGANGSPRYDRQGFPVAPTDRTARRRRRRSRVLTTTVVATVLAAPLLALWVAYRNAPEAGETDVMPTVAAHRAHDAREAMGMTPGDLFFDGRPYEQPGNARSAAPRRGLLGSLPGGDGASDVSVAVLGVDTGPTPPGGGREQRGPGRLTVDARPASDTTVITIRASGGTPVRWRAAADAPWLQMSHTAGELRPGQTAKITVYVDHDREPEGRWRSAIAIDPGGRVVRLEGHGAAEGTTGTDAPADPQGPAPAGTPASPAPTPALKPETKPVSPSPRPTGGPVRTRPVPSSTPAFTSKPASRPTARPTSRPAGPTEGPTSAGGTTPPPQPSPQPPKPSQTARPPY